MMDGIQRMETESIKVINITKGGRFVRLSSLLFIKL